MKYVVRDWVAIFNDVDYSLDTIQCRLMESLTCLLFLGVSVFLKGLLYFFLGGHFSEGVSKIILSLTAMDLG